MKSSAPLRLTAALFFLPLALAAEDITVAPDFKLEEIHDTETAEGSWVSLCVDPKGDLIAADQYGGLWRVTPPPLGTSEGAKVERLKIEAGRAHGLLWAFDSLYIMGTNLDATGKNLELKSLYRAQDTKGNGEFDKVERIVTLEGGGEHGPHQLALSPDGKRIVFAAGNHTPVPTFARSRAAQLWQEDMLLPRMWDPNGHAREIYAPGGFIATCNPDGTDLEMIGSGFRNQYDFAFDANGEVFSYDSDMEWDVNLPWYRPTRICHVVSGADFGWRSGSGVWPDYLEDSNPPVVNIGPGSPTGVLFGTGAKFPAKYQHALLAMDWSFGTLYAIHLRPKGASYEGTPEVFVARNAFPLTDMVVRPQDGALYFTTGGRKTASSLYRLTYTGSESTAPAPLPPLTQLQQLRRQLEKHHHPNDPEAIGFAWPYLDHEDRFIRFAARLAIEQQPVAQWQAKALAENRPYALREALIALARCTGDKGVQSAAFDRLLSQDWAKLDPAARLGWLRAAALLCTRLGEPQPAVATKLLGAIDASFPTGDDMVNRELVNFLIYLKSPTVVAKAVELMYSAQDPPAAKLEESYLQRGGGYGKKMALAQAQLGHRQQIHYAFHLRNATVGWTEPLQERYFAWFGPAQDWSGGNSFVGYLKNARNKALERVNPPSTRERLLALATKRDTASQEIPRAQGPGKEYTAADFAGVTVEQLAKRDLPRGKKMFHAALCASCHHFGNEGGGSGAGGPDLTGAAARYTVADLVTSIVEPNKVVSDQYAFTEFKLRDDTTVLGRVAREDNVYLYLITSFLAPEALTPVKKGAVISQAPASVSPMISGLLNSLNKEEALDLLAYLMSGGK